MNSIIQLFNYQFFTNAIIAAIFTSISCGIVGTWVVAKRNVFISGGITHASFGGIGIAYFLGLNPILGAIVFACATALGIEFVSRRTEVREDSVIAILWSLGMALGIIFIFLTPGYTPNLMSYLFGSILSVSTVDIVMATSIAGVVILFFSLFYKPILFIAFDEEYARTHKLPIQPIKYILVILVALTIVLNIRVVGIILVLSLLTIPQTIANLFTKSFKNIIFISIFTGFIGSVGGILVAYWLDIPPGASIIFLLVTIFIFVKIIKTILFSIALKRNISNQYISPNE